MEEFAKMIYRQWRNSLAEGSDEYNDIDWADYNEAIARLHDFLNENIANELEYAINRNVWTVEQNAFIAGFGYACKCLSNGKIEFGGR